MTTIFLMIHLILIIVIAVLIGVERYFESMGKVPSNKSQISSNKSQVPDWYYEFMDKIAEEPERTFVPIEIDYHEMNAIHQEHAQYVKTFRTGLIEAKDALRIITRHHDRGSRSCIGFGIEGGKLFVWRTPDSYTTMPDVFDVKKLRIFISADHKHVRIYNVEDLGDRLMWVIRRMNE